LKRFGGSHVKLFWAIPHGERFPLPGKASDVPPMAEVAVAELAVWLTLALALALLRGQTLWRNDSRYRGQVTLGLCWTLPLLLFTAVYEPQHPFYRLFYLFPLVYFLLAPWALGPPLMAGVRLDACGAILLLTALINAQYAWVPRADSEINAWLTGLDQYAHVPSKVLLVVPVAGLAPEAQIRVDTQRAYLEAFDDRPILRLRPVTAEEALAALGSEAALDEAAREARGRLVHSELWVAQIPPALWPERGPAYVWVGGIPTAIAPSGELLLRWSDWLPNYDSYHLGEVDWYRLRLFERRRAVP
ncbi:MAG TPA: hypothetical protein VEI97_18400, partial [bacterium]|nr:hypothetical protein [bacterium]